MVPRFFGGYVSGLNPISACAFSSDRARTRMIRTHVVAMSGNAKTGPMATTYRTQNTCPPSCPLLGNGCYASGRIFAIATKYGSGELAAVRRLVKTLPLNGGVRLNVSGDFLTAEGDADLAYIEACNHIARRRPDVKIIAYTHAWRQLTPAMFAFPVNASCETDAEIEQALEVGWQAVTVDGVLGQRFGDRQVIQCPNETRGIQCIDCGACAASTRTRPIISFTAHGGSKKRVAAAVQAKRQEVA